MDTEARDAEWTVIDQAHQDLLAMRQELRDLREKIRQGHEALSEEETEGMSPEEAYLKLQEKAAQLDEEVKDRADEFSKRLVDFINAVPMLEGEEPTERQRAALAMKTGEDIEVALEYIEEGGDYRQAIQIFETAMKTDPGNARLREELEKAQTMRYMTEERFAGVKKGMSQDEIREVLGPVYYRNVKDYEDRGIQRWLYQKEDGGVAAVYFRKRRGVWTVYNMNFDAASRQVIESEGG